MFAYEELLLYNISSIKRVTRKFHVVVVQNNGKEMYTKDFFSLIRPIDFLPFSLPSPFSITIGSFSNDDGDGNENGKKAIGLLRKITTLLVHHTFLYISSPSLHDQDVKMPNFTFYGERKQGTTNFFFLFLNLSPVPLKSTPGKFAYFHIFSELE